MPEQLDPHERTQIREPEFAPRPDNEAAVFAVQKQVEGQLGRQPLDRANQVTLRPAEYGQSEQEGEEEHQDG